MLVCKNCLEECISRNPVHQNCIDDNWLKIKTDIRNGVKQALGTRVIKIPPQKNSKPSWLCEEISALAETKRKVFLLHFKGVRTADSHYTYNTVKNEVNQRIKQIKRDFGMGTLETWKETFMVNKRESGELYEIRRKKL